MNDNTIMLSVNPRDRLTIATTIERLINLLDVLEPDVDLEEGGDAEPWLGWTDKGPQALAKGVEHDDREEECEDEGGQCDDEGMIDFDAPGVIWGGGEDAPRNHSGL
ncbi:hypothetical protein [Mesorhizobium australicum]|uniref:Uncharacterized protein n=1 Tax=Mesorhizobium australicum TaxID=536018 RepID=A0A1X7NG03_9HYPH|nr:hypothetical protein [Mesorhizobium australicum]SMH36036.1 hypothetical protein SAMN02982922_1677 [Mesorhizobium australicum]